jgi:hypothetical protein
MLLKELLSIIGFNKLQQICLIKILFLTGAIGFVPPTVEKLKDPTTIHINKLLLSSNVSSNSSLNHNNEIISFETAESILDNAKFISNEKAFTWLDNIMQKKFHRGHLERHEIEDKFKNFVKLNKLIQKFDLIGEIRKEGHFDFVVVTGCSEKCIKNKTLFLSRQLIENKIKADHLYFIGSERPAYPYLESTIETVLAENLMKENNLSFKENLDSVKKIFIKVANEHLFPLYHLTPSKMSEIRKIFKDHPKLFNIQLLLDKLKAEPLFANIKWPNETDIILRTSRKTLKKYKVNIIETQNKQVGPHITRGTTKDSAISWKNEIENTHPSLSHKPRVLLISNQPKSLYQYNIFKSILGNDYDISLAASSCYGKQNISLLLSELASIIHESKELILKEYL